MLPSFNSNKVISLIDKDTNNIEVVDKINIILTPSFYWMKRTFLEVKFTRSALKYAPAIFEGILPEGDYTYYVVKDKDEFIFFAYNPDDIISSLRQKGILASQIAGIYFAQNEMGNITTPIECNYDDAIILYNGAILQVKKYLVDESELKRSLEDIKQLSKHKITLHKSSIIHWVKELIPMMVVLSALIFLYAIQLFSTYGQQKTIEAMPSVFKEYKLPSTFVQNVSIEKRLRKSFKDQKSFRKLIFSILRLPLLQRQNISSLNYEKETFIISFKMDDYTGLRDIKLHLRKELGALVKIDIHKNIMKVNIK